MDMQTGDNSIFLLTIFSLGQSTPVRVSQYLSRPATHRLWHNSWYLCEAFIIFYFFIWFDEPDVATLKSDINLNQVNAKENGDAVKAVGDVAVRVLHQKLDRLPKDIIEYLQSRGSIEDEEFGHKQKLTTGVVHHGVLQDNLK